MFNVYSVKAPLQNRFQASFNKIAKSKAAISKAQLHLAEATKRFYGLCNATFGENSYVIYESREPYSEQRLARQISQPRSIDIDYLKEHLSPEQFAAVTETRTVIELDMTALDNALASGDVDADIVSDATSYGLCASLVLSKTATRTEYPLAAGQLAVVRKAPLVLQES
jgi:hypothetical protein